MNKQYDKNLLTVFIANFLAAFYKDEQYRKRIDKIVSSCDGIKMFYGDTEMSTVESYSFILMGLASDIAEQYLKKYYEENEVDEP